MLEPTGPPPAMRSGTVAILVTGMLVTAVVRGAVALASILNIGPVFGMFDIALYSLPSLPYEWAVASWQLDWGLTACGVLASVLIVAPRALRPFARRRAAHVLAWIMAADAIIYLASFIWLFLAAPPTFWQAVDGLGWAAAGISIGSLCTFWTAVVVLRRTANRHVQ